MKTHASALTKPRCADSNDVQEAMDFVSFIGTILNQINTFVAGIKSQASS